MLTQTSELAIRSLLLLALDGDGPQPPRQLAESLGCSPSYLAKTMAMLVRAGVLQSVRGARGGVVLSRDPADITLLEIVEASQGLLIGNYCHEISLHGNPVCAFHQAMNELHAVMTETLTRWTLKDLIERPYGESAPVGVPACKMLTAGVLADRPVTISQDAETTDG